MTGVGVFFLAENVGSLKTRISQIMQKSKYLAKKKNKKKTFIHSNIGLVKNYLGGLCLNQPVRIRKVMEDTCCEIEDFEKNHICKLRGILLSHVLLPYDRSFDGIYANSCCKGIYVNSCCT